MYTRKLVIVYRKTRLDELLARHCTLGQVEFYLTRLGDDVEAYKDEHARYYQELNNFKSWASGRFSLQMLEREHVSRFSFANDDIVVVMGQDGLVANVLKYAKQQGIIAINPLPDLYDGKLLAFTPKEARQMVISEVQGQALNFARISMASVKTSVGQSLLAVNDLFIGPKTHSSLRYTIRINNTHEEQSSSGIIVSTGLGASGWLSSIIAGAEAISGKPLRKKIAHMQWDSNQLCFNVREPFPSRATHTNVVFGFTDTKHPLKLTSKTAENAVIFSDGIESDSINFTAGTVATIELAETKGKLIIS